MGKQNGDDGGKKIREFKNKGWIKSRGTTNKEKKEI